MPARRAAVAGGAHAGRGQPHPRRPTDRELPARSLRHVPAGVEVRLSVSAPDGRTVAWTGPARSGGAVKCSRRARMPDRLRCRSSRDPVRPRRRSAGLLAAFGSGGRDRSMRATNSWTLLHRSSPTRLFGRREVGPAFASSGLTDFWQTARRAPQRFLSGLGRKCLYMGSEMSC